MSKNKTLTIPILKPKVKIDNDAKHQLLNELLEESQVTFHCSCTAIEINKQLQICDTTFLFSHQSTHKSKMVHSENIAIYPSWTQLKKGTTAHFVLIFTGLPKSCVSFDLIESITLSGPFIVKNIKRNKTDVYHVDLSNTVL